MNEKLERSKLRNLKPKERRPRRWSASPKKKPRRENANRKSLFWPNWLPRKKKRN